MRSSSDLTYQCVAPDNDGPLANVPSMDSRHALVAQQQNDGIYAVSDPCGVSEPQADGARCCDAASNVMPILSRPDLAIDSTDDPTAIADRPPKENESQLSSRSSRSMHKRCGSISGLSGSVPCWAEPLGGGVYVYCDDIHRFSVDSILLAWFASPRAHEQACDLGTGCGIIPLLWVRDGGPKKCAAVEIQPQAVSLLHRAVEEQELFKRILPLCADLRALEGILPAGSCDLVSCNPPYFPIGSGKSSPDPALATARQELCCTLENATAAAARLLHPGGRFCLCHRPERLCDLLGALRAARLEPKRLRLVSHRVGDAPFLVLVEGRRCARPGLRVEDTTVLDQPPWATRIRTGILSIEGDD